ncbi:gas vesicle accessory protein GvpU [Psychrobacillus psychrodurans]|uniref:gas vesicle accessory protein GvpU n=1 Tax=Psychrobacillus psychrodurans TaxID=126157 RepID=UPI003CFCC52D
MEKDIILNLLNEMASSEFGIEVSITLNVKGSIVTGTLINYEKYLSGTKQFIEDNATGKYRDVFSEVFNKLQENHEKFLLEEKLNEDEPKKFNFIHLKNAKYHFGDVAVPDQGNWWRGKIESIDGFTIGSIA